MMQESIETYAQDLINRVLCQIECHHTPGARTRGIRLEDILGLVQLVQTRDWSLRDTAILDHMHKMGTWRIAFNPTERKGLLIRRGLPIRQLILEIMDDEETRAEEIRADRSDVGPF